ncbi:MAG: hypothetical protein ABIH99_05550 [Candidatus Micrarchaeota archaeon]
MASELETLANAIQSAFKTRNVGALRKISNECTQKYTTTQNHAFIALAMASYALSKISGKAHHQKYVFQKRIAFFVQKELENAAKYAQEGNSDAFERELVGLFSKLEMIDARDKRFVRDLLDKSKVKISATLYAQGYSLSGSAAITGADKRELLKYSGGTLISDRAGKTKRISERLDHGRKLLN